MEGFTIIGWIGAITFVVAYLLLSIHALSANKSLYHILNILGGICLVINSVYLDDTPNLFVNLVWVAIASYSIYKIYKLSNKKLRTNPQNR